MCRKWIATALRRIRHFKPELDEVPLEDKLGKVVVVGKKDELAKLVQSPVPKELKELTQRYLRPKRLVRAVRTGRGGPNMPKYQPCPQCHGGAKRREKMGELGANYFCCRHQVSFLVRA